MSFVSRRPQSETGIPSFSRSKTLTKWKPASHRTHQGTRFCGSWFANHADMTMGGISPVWHNGQLSDHFNHVTCWRRQDGSRKPIFTRNCVALHELGYLIRVSECPVSIRGKLQRTLLDKTDFRFSVHSPILTAVKVSYKSSAHSQTGFGAKTLNLPFGFKRPKDLK